MKPAFKKYAIIGVLVLVTLTVLFLVLGRNKSPKDENAGAEPTEMVIPTVDASVKVDLSSVAGNKEVLLTAEGIPPGTETVDYELSYQTAQQGLQGVIGTVSLSGKDSFEKKLTLGTCSSGTCVYHQVVGKIKLTLKFNGSYGEKLFEKEYAL